jgi:hypothetical protein
MGELTNPAAIADTFNGGGASYTYSFQRQL